MSKKIAIRVIIVAVLVAVGFVYLIRSCLATFDERASIGGGGSASGSGSQFLVFVPKDSSGEKEGKPIIFSLVQFEKTTSYSQKGGSTRRSVSRTFYAQTNDLITAAKVDTRKIKSGREIKAYPVELLGASSDKAWLFASELMAYDPYTLIKLVDAASLEEKNPMLKGKLINERRYYDFNNANQTIRITAADGVSYDLNTNTLVAVPAEVEKTINIAEKKQKDLTLQVRLLREIQRLTYDRRRENNRQYQEKLLSLRQYRDSTEAFNKAVNALDRRFDSLDVVEKELRSQQHSEEENLSRKKNARHTGSGFGGMKLNSDSMDSRWYGLYTNEELEKISDRFDHHKIYNEAARNKLFTAGLTRKDNYWTIGEPRTEASNAFFLQGGFLINKETGLPFHLHQDFLIVYKDKIGNEGVVQLARIAGNGKQLWSISTELKEFYDWQQAGDKLIVAGTDNKKLTSGEVNVMHIINLRHGGVVTYDFFKDKIRSGK